MFLESFGILAARIMKKLIIGAFFLIFSGAIFAEKVNFFSKDYSLSFQNGLSLENGSDFAPVTQSVDFSSYLDYHELFFSSGFKILPESMDFTTKAIYWPTLFNHFNTGVGTIFHLQDYHDTFLELDFLNGIFFKYDSLKVFSVSANFLHLYKAAKIYNLPKKYQWIVNNNNMALDVNFNFQITNSWNLYLDFASYSYYRYMLFFAPDIKLGANFHFSKTFVIGTEIEGQYIDMFTLSANLNSFSIRSYLQVEL